MLEKKFRAWDRVEKEYMYFTLARLIEDHGSDYGCILLGDANDLEPPEQFIGYYDKNDRNKEIYENDIVIASWHWEKPHTVELPGDYYHIIEYGIGDEMEVIGSTHESP
jgi:hypothetical protein